MPEGGMRIGVVGATGAVGRVTLRLLRERGHGDVRAFASARSAGCSLELMHLSKQIQHLLGLTNLFSIFTIIGENGVKFM